MPIHTRLASWQALQPELTPLWICAPLGAGVAKPVPGAVRVAEAAISPLGVLAPWQVSQLLPAGMCEPVPGGLVGGWPTMRVMPAKGVLLPAGWWQAAQLAVMPAWFISEPPNFAPSTTGSAPIDEPAPTWQVSQEAVVGMWLLGCPTIAKPTAGIANEAAAEPWHCAQLPVVLGALAWMLDSDGNTA
jgi:hypothetical protein